jgi:hypothetical protein
VVICTLHAPALTHIDLAKAAKAAGVKLFLPSEFGTPGTTGPPGDNVFSQKLRIREVLKEIGLPYALIFTGPWPDFCLSPCVALLNI